MGDNPLPFSQEHSKIPTSVFVPRFLLEQQNHPFHSAYLGKTNPYDSTLIQDESDYYRYLREHTYHLLCEEATVLTVQKHRAKIDGDFLQIEKLNDDLSASLQTKEKIIRRQRYIFVLLTVFFLAYSLLATIGMTRAPSLTYEDGYSEGRSVQESSDASLYADGYAAGLADQEKKDAGLYDAAHADGYQSGYAAGKDEGYNAGYHKGYWEGYADAGERSDPGTGDSHGSRSVGGQSDGGPREDPVADTYIGNKTSKKFHLPTCSYLPDKDNQVTFDSRDEAIAAGYKPCGHCNP